MRFANLCEPLVGKAVTAHRAQYSTATEGTVAPLQEACCQNPKTRLPPSWAG